MPQFKFYRQLDSVDCGPACIRMIAHYYGKSLSLRTIREMCSINQEGVSLKSMTDVSEKLGFRSIPVKIPFTSGNKMPSLSDAPLPAIIHWNNNHFIVLISIGAKKVYIADPGKGKLKVKIKDFLKYWKRNDESGVALLLEPSLNFYDTKVEDAYNKDYKLFKTYVKPYTKLVIQLFLGLLVGAMLQLLFPLCAQAIVDTGISQTNVNFVLLMIIGMFVLFIGQLSIKFIQNWILLHISVRINVHIITDFLTKLFQLKLGFFESKMTGDLIQRIGDHKRIEYFLTSVVISTLISSISFFAYASILFYYSSTIFFVMVISSIAYCLWIFLFMKRRKDLDFLVFNELASNQNSLIEIIQGIQEIKIQGSHHKRKFNWIKIQANLFKLRVKQTVLSQFQDGGASIINSSNELFITYIAAISVINGNITIGMMMSIIYIIGQLKIPMSQLIVFFKARQDTNISLERLGEIYNSPVEEIVGGKGKIDYLPPGDIIIKNAYFRYGGVGNSWTLENINATIKRGKINAIVGKSGSGKTTILKLLLGFYELSKGRLYLGDIPLNSVKFSDLRDNIGVVMQESYVFSDSIANNIAENSMEIDISLVIRAATMANIHDFISELPYGYNTIIGANGIRLSQGQKQRLIIARALYKEPDIIFLDEATNSLDAANEMVIIENFKKNYKSKTLVVIAHRLSTIQNADNIIVLENGHVSGIGTHESLIREKGEYYELIKNQLSKSW